MDTVLDKYGNGVGVVGVWFAAEMWVIVLMPNDIPVACLSIDVNTKVSVGWEEYEGLLDRIQRYKEGDTVRWEENGKEFLLAYHKADFSAVMSGEKVLSCSAIKENGEAICGWTDPNFRGSMTLYVWACCLVKHLLETIYIPKGINDIYWLVGVDNIAPRKLHTGVGAKIDSVLEINGVRYNKCVIKALDMIEYCSKLKLIWMSNSLEEITQNLPKLLESYSIAEVV